MDLLNDYYGDTIDDNHKENICDFIEMEFYSIKKIISEE